ncbi:MAG: hypothetical protein K8L99_26945 [Anaerolineae bacterium]|nr:hypothetical protein [Anaerolineae bacterium]
MRVLFSKTVAMLLILLIFVGWAETVSSQEAPEPTPEMPSLIVGDPCTPPCWLGMRAGETTAEEAFQILSANADLFWNEFVEVGRTDDDLPVVHSNLNLQPLLDEGGIHFYWRNVSFGGRTSIGSFLSFRDGVMSAMQIKPNVSVTLADALQQLKQPDVIRVGGSVYDNIMTLYYRKQGLILELLADNQTCEIRDMLDAFQVEHVYYLTPTTYQEEARDRLTYTYYLPDEVMQRWIAGEVDASCSEAIELLHD